MVRATRPAATPFGRLALLGSAGALLAAVVFAGGGSGDERIATVGGAAVALAAIGLSLGASGAIPLPRPDRAASLVVGAVFALALWAAVTIAWSLAGDASWSWANRGLVYGAALVLGGLVAWSTRWVATVVSLVLGAAVGWALLGVAIPSLFADGDRVARLREPVGYWNALALLADGALVLGLWAGGSERRARRVAGAALVFGSVLVVLLTQSRAGVVAGAVVVLLWLLLSSRRLESALSLVLAGGPGALVGAWAFTRPALVEDGVGRAARVDEAPLFASVAGAGLALAVVLALVVSVDALVRARRQAVVRMLAVAACVALLGGLGGTVVAVGNPISWARDQVSGGECANDPGRFAELCANNRLAWWGEALDVARAHPVGGSGAGTFSIARLRVRDDATAVREPHSVPLQLVADTGVVGLALGLLVALGAIVGLRAALRRLDGDEREAAAALVALPAAFGLHALVDYPLDFAAVAVPSLFVAGVLLAAGRPAAIRRGGIPELLGVVTVAVGIVALLALPELARREVRAAYDASYEGRLVVARDTAERARSLDPLSLEPLYALADVADRDGSQATAVGWYERATRLQPENPETWVALGRYHFLTTGDLCQAYTALNAAYTLDPNSRRWVPGGPLDASRDAVNDGACEE